VLGQVSNEISAALLGAGPYGDTGGEWCVSVMIAAIPGGKSGSAQQSRRRRVNHFGTKRSHASKRNHWLRLAHRRRWLRDQLRSRLHLQGACGG